jgi:hypothetical protein
MLALGRPLGKPSGNPLALRAGKGQNNKIPAIVGTPFGGGYYAGRMRGGDGKLYAIICSPLEPPFDGLFSIQADGINQAVSRSDWDANSNQASMLASDIPYNAAQACADYRGGGFDDWVLPAYAQLVMLYRAFKPNNTLNSAGLGDSPYTVPNPGPYTATDPPQTSVPEFQPPNGDSFLTAQYHTSTLSAGGNTIISFSNGSQTTQGALAALRPVRAIRMIRVAR